MLSPENSCEDNNNVRIGAQYKAQPNSLLDNNFQSHSTNLVITVFSY